MEIQSKQLNYYIQLKMYEKAAAILDKSIEDAIINYDMVRLIELIERIPDQMMMEKPNIGIYSALAFFLTKRLNEIEPALRLVEEVLDSPIQERFSDEEKHTYRWKVAVVRLVKSFRYDNQVDELILPEIIQNVPRNESYLFGIMNHTMAEYYLQRLDFTKGAEAYIRGVNFAQKNNIIHGHVFSLCGLARIYKEQGKLREAEWTYRRAAKLLLGSTGYVGAHTLIRSGIAEGYLLQNEMEKARELMEFVIPNTESVEANLNFWYETLLVYIRIGFYYLFQQQIPEAQKYLDLAVALWKTNSNSTVVMPPELISLYKKLWIDTDRIEEGITWFENRIQYLDSLKRPVFSELVAYSQLQIAKSEPEKALESLLRAEGVTSEFRLFFAYIPNLYLEIDLLFSQWRAFEVIY